MSSFAATCGRLVRRLRENGTTIILTTHYIEEAEEMADRVGVIRQGELIVVEEKRALMRKLGKKELKLLLSEPLAAIPAELGDWDLRLGGDGRELTYVFDAMPSGPESLAADRDAGARNLRSRTSTPASRASRRFSSSWSTNREPAQ
jgi:ABC-2 type transport system ATP-binding protein